MNTRLFLIAAILSSAACSDADEMEREIASDKAAATASDAGEASPPNDAQPVRIEESSELIDLSYSWPAQASAIAPLASRLRANADTAREELVAAASEDQAAAAEAEYTFRPHALSVDWQVVADLPDWLSLSAKMSTYSGGAHPNQAFDSLVWDRRAQTERAPTDLFRSPQSLQGAVAARFCDMLDAERARRRDEPVDPDAGDSFNSCPSIAEVTVLLGSSNGETFDRIGFLVMPYVAGPYAEGFYEFTLPVDTAVLDAVKPEFEKAFSLGPRNSRN